MCERLDSIRAVGAAADELTAACAPRPQSFRKCVNGTLAEPFPEDFTAMLGTIDRHDREQIPKPKITRGRRHASH